MSNYFDDDHIITEQDLDEIAEAVEEADDLHQRYMFLSVQKIPCPECGGQGNVYGGSLGNACPTCCGARMVDHPGSVQPQLPGFAKERAALGAYVRAQRNQGTKREVPLPLASSLPRPESIRMRTTEIREISRRLGSAPQLKGQLAEPKKQAVGSLGDGEAEYSDEEIDACIEEDYGQG